MLFGSRAQGTARPDSDLDLAVICGEPELNSQLRTKRWHTYRAALGGLSCGIDLVLQGQVDAATVSESSWQVMKDVHAKGWCSMPPSEDAQLLLRIVERHLRTIT